MRAAIISNGSIHDYESCKQRLKKVDLIICADGGTRHAYHMGIVPDMIMGDMDSAEKEYMKHYEELQVPFMKYNPIKDSTDTQICLEYAMDLCQEIWLFGATGTRLDHTMGNISLLRQAADRGISACIMDEYNEIYVIKDKISFEGVEDDIISLLPLSGVVEGITIKGVKYPLKDAVMEIGNPYGVSNRFVGGTVEVSIKTGYMAVIRSKD